MRRGSVQKHVTDAASKLIKSGDYLRLPDSSEVSDDCVGRHLIDLFSRASTRTLYHRFSKTDVKTFTTATEKGVEVDGGISTLDPCPRLYDFF